jgi:3-oxoacyl-[acyl-carrier protein] reductase
MSGRLQGKVAIVSGAGCIGPGWGNGRAMAVIFAQEGAKVFAADKSLEAMSETLERVRETGGEIEPHRCDATDGGDVERMVAACRARFGRVDILVNNAGIFTESLLEDMPVEDWDRVVATNLRGVFLCTRMLIGQMLERGDGRIINIASQLGQIGGTSVAHYCASKAGVIGLTKALAREVATRGVLVNAIAPGPIETPLLDSETEEWRSAKLAELPIGRFGAVAEVTPTALLLASADGSYYVGQTLGPNGGDVML